MPKRWFHKYTALVRATRLQRLAATGLIVLALISVAQSNLLVVLQKQIDFMLSAVLPGVIVELTNEERVAQDLGTLKRNPLLDEAARLKAMHMRSEEYFAHWSPEGVSPWFWFDQAGYNYVHAGENLAIYFDESDDVVEAWMDSPLHRDNILRDEYTEIGVAAVEGEYKGYDTVYIVQLFGTPAATPAQVAVATVPAAPIPAPEPETTVLAVEETPAPEEEVAEEVPEPEEILPVPEPVSPTEETETVEELPAEEPQDAEEPVVVASGVPAITAEDTAVTPVTVLPTGTGVAYVSDHAATSSGKVAALTTPSYQAPESIHAPRMSAQEARAILQTFYALLAVIVGGLLVASIIIAEKHLHHAQAALGSSLLMVMLLLVGMHAYFTQTVSAAF